MKKIISLIAITAVAALIFIFAACGNETKNDIENGLTTLKEEASSAMDEMSSALNGIDDAMTSEGNVTDSNSSTGLFEDMTSDKNEADTSTTNTEVSTTETTKAAD